ncbi:hypothetical protein LUZ60_007485 [Juncus effusus]|nr:hypothetical protein LUZ60_007485 [Juncus effusus]
MSTQMQTLIQNLKDTIGNISSRYSQNRSVQPTDSNPQTNPWDRVPLEILREVIGWIERNEDDSLDWKDRKNLSVCAAVCRSWRKAVLEMAKPVELSGRLTFAASLKQPGPRDGFIKCFIKRIKFNKTYTLFLSVSDDLHSENGKFLLAARKYYYPTYTEYVISMNSKHIQSSSRWCLGKLRSNFVGTKYVIYNVESSLSSAYPTTGVPPQPRKWPGGMKFFSKKNSTKFCAIGNISYKQNWGHGEGPRTINCVINSIPNSSICTGSAEDFEGTNNLSETPVPTNNVATEIEIPVPTNRTNPPIILKNKNPRWHEQLHCWCLNFSGRVTFASIKNFQLIGSEPDSDPTRDPDITLQFGKVGSDIFTMDYQYPISAFQAFAICLTNFDSKLASE